MRAGSLILDKVSKNTTAALVPRKELYNYVKLVGKNSKFLTSLRSHYLDEETLAWKAKSKSKTTHLEAMYNASRLNMMTKAALNAENAYYNSQILGLLREITPTHLKTQDHTQDMAGYRILTRYNKTVHSEVPKMPSSLNSESFKDYVKALTTYKYTYKNASDQSSGIVVPLLKHLFSDENEISTKLSTTETYNMAIVYFLKLNDLDYARHLLRTMQKENVIPSTLTYNSFLWHLARPKNAFTTNPLLTAIQLLKQMKSKDLQADLSTWYMILKITRLDPIFCKDVCQVYFRELGLPSTSQLLSIILELEFEEITSKEMISRLETLKGVPSQDLVHLILRKMLNERLYQETWEFVNHMVSKHQFHVSATTLQLFLEEFENRELIHLSLGAFYSFMARFKVSPTPANFRSLFAVTTKVGFHTNWRAMARIVFAEMQRIQGNARNNAGYWIARLKARALVDKFCQMAPLDLASPLSQDEKSLLTKIRSNLVWGKQLTILPENSKRSPFIEACLAVGARHSSRKQRKPKYTMTDKDRGTIEAFKDKTKRSNLRKTNVQRALVVAKGPSRHLTDNLLSRGLVPSTSTLEQLGISDTKNGNKKA